MNSHDIGRGRGGVAAALARIEARSLVLGIDSDRYFPLAGQREIAARLRHSVHGDAPGRHRLRVRPRRLPHRRPRGRRSARQPAGGVIRRDSGCTVSGRVQTDGPMPAPSPRGGVNEAHPEGTRPTAAQARARLRPDRCASASSPVHHRARHRRPASSSPRRQCSASPRAPSSSLHTERGGARRPRSVSSASRPR